MGKVTETLAITKSPVYSYAVEDFNAESEEVKASEVFWTEEEERKIVRKLDMYVLPLLVYAFFSLQLDRSNISNALTDTITTDLGMTINEITSGNQLQNAAIVVAELPSNYLLQLVGPHRWLFAQSLAWGCVGVFQSFCNNKPSFYATRWLLGMFEAGLIPGALYYLSGFYKRKEMAVRTAVFYFGNYFATAIGSIIAAGILRHYQGSSWGGWRYLFVIDGSFTLLASVLFFFLLPKGTYDTRPEHNMFSFFTEREQEILHTRIMFDDPTKTGKTFASLSTKQFFKALGIWRVWVHFAINVLSLTPKGALSVFSPLIIKSLGFDVFRANALNAVSSFGCCILSFLINWTADRTNQKGLLCIIANSWSIVFCGVITSMTIGVTPKWTMYAMITLLGSGNALSQALNDAWVSVNAKSFEERSVGLALCVMGSNIGGLAGAKVFHAPKYKSGFVIILCVYCASLVVIAGLSIANYVSNKKLEKMEQMMDEEAPKVALVEKGWRFHV